MTSERPWMSNLEDIRSRHGPLVWNAVYRICGTTRNRSTATRTCFAKFFNGHRGKK